MKMACIGKSTSKESFIFWVVNDWLCAHRVCGEDGPNVMRPVQLAGQTHELTGTTQPCARYCSTLLMSQPLHKVGVVIPAL